MSIELKQSKNNVEIIGLMKSVNFERKEIGNDRRMAMTGNAVIEVVDGDKVNNIRVEVFSFKLTKAGAESKLYKGLVTVADEFKTIDKDGRDQADLVRVTGRLSGNAYVSDGELRESTRVSGTFFNRVEGEQEQSALAQLDLAINGFSDVVDADGVPTGVKKVDAFFVEYGNRISKVIGLEVSGELADQFGELFSKGDTTELTMKIQNYVTHVEDEKPVSGFGVQKQLGGGGSFTSNFEIIGGTEAYMDGREYTGEEFEAILAGYEEMKKAKMADGGNSGISKGSTNGFGTKTSGGGFGSAATSNPFAGSVTESNDDFAF